MQLPNPSPGLAGEGARELASELAQRGGLAWFELALDRGERIADAGVRAALLDAAESAVRERGGACGSWRGGTRLSWCAGGLDLKGALAAARAVVEALRALRIDHGGAACSATASVGVAVSRPEVSFEALVGVAEEGLSVARAGGGNRAAHTELYALVQPRVGGEALSRAPRRAEPPPVEPERELEDVAAAPLVSAATAVRSDDLRVAAAASLGPRPLPRQVERAPAEAGDRDERIEILERRIAKLILALAQAEARISSLEREQGREGIASIYREVQGLDPTAPAFDTKRRIMARIFEANLALQAKYAS